MLPASFRGVPFEVEGAEGEDGRKKVVVPIPGRDVPYVQDLGAATQTVRLEGFVHGSDYLPQRDALLAALRQPGQGELVHPWYGTRTASVVEVRVRESSMELGMARFSIRVVLDAEEVAIVAASDVVSATGAAADGVRAASTASVGTRVGSFSSNLGVREARFEAQGVTQSLDGLVRSGARAGGALENDQVAGLVRELEGLADMALRDGDDFSIWLQGIQSGVGSFGNGLTSRIGAFQAIMGFVESLLRDDTTEARDAVRVPVGASALAEAAVQAAAVGEGWGSRQEATAARVRILEAARALQDRAEDVVSESLASLRAAVAGAVPDPAVELPELGRYTPPDTQPALVASARIYGTPERDEEIARRNGVRHPGFLRAQAPLEVLIDA